MKDAKIALELTKPEAIVLVEFLLRFRDKDSLAIEDEAESQILWDLCCMIEDKVPELLDPRWNEHLIAARKKVADTSEW